jgi:hypothetical protein
MKKVILFGVVVLLIVTASVLFLIQKKSSFSYKTSSATSQSGLQSVPPSASPSPTITPEADTELIKQALVDKNGWTDLEAITITVTSNDGKFAKGSTSSTGGGGYFFAAKVGDTWSIVADGNGMIFCDDLVKYPDFPNTLIPECYDSATDTTVTR